MEGDYFWLLFFCISIMLLQSINKSCTLSVYHNMQYISTSIGDINLKEIEYERLMKNYQAIIFV